jgi:hypothetical protein
MKKLLTVSLVAVMAVSAAHADIASTTYVTDRTGSNTYAGQYTKDSTNLTAAVEALDAAIQGIEAVAGTVDQTVVEKSKNPVAGGAVYTELAGKQDNLSEAQLNAVNSGITSAKVTEFEGKQNALPADSLAFVPKECADTLCALTIDTAGNAVWTPVK